jgi:hypothetical protein
LSRFSSAGALQAPELCRNGENGAFSVFRTSVVFIVIFMVSVILTLEINAIMYWLPF